jgi:hypothetical protein
MAEPVRETRSRPPVVLPKGRLLVTVGVHGEQGAEDHRGELGFANDGAYGASGGALTVADVGTFHEFGVSPFQMKNGEMHPGIPQRSFIRAWFDESQDFIQETLRSQMLLVVAGKITAETAGKRIALAFEGSVKQRIAKGIGPPLAARTIAAKGSSKPLIRYGQLRAAVLGKGKLEP